MAGYLGIVTCASFDREVRSLQSSPEFRDILFRVLQVRCDQVDADWGNLAESVAPVLRDGCSARLVGGYCLTGVRHDARLGGAVRLCQKSQCVEWVADKDVADRFVRDGALLVIPGWLKAWEEHVEARWPSDRKAALAFFRELAGRVVLLDTGVYPKVDDDLKSFARFLKLPAEVYPAGLGYFKLSLGELVQSWRLDLEKTGADNRLAAVEKRMSDYARMGHLLKAVADAKTADDARAGVLELFRILLAPQKVVFHGQDSLPGQPFPEGSPWDRIVALNADYAWAEDRRTLYLKVSAEREFLGVLEVAGLEEGPRREHQLDMALALARIAGLSLMNARTGLALALERDRAMSAEATLKAGEEKMTLIFSYPLGLYRITPEGQILDATPTLARMLDYPDVASLKRVNFWDFHDDRYDKDNWHATLAGSSFVHIFEAQLRRRDGSLFWAKDSVRAARDSRGRVLFYDGVIEDITAKKQIEDDHSWDMKLQASVSDVSERLLSPTPIEEMSAVVRDHARRLTSSATALVGYVEERTGRLVPAAMTPDALAMLRDHPEVTALHSGSAAWRPVLRDRHILRMNSPSLDPRFSGTPGWHVPIQHVLAVPAVMEGALVGLIAVANPANPYIERDERAVERLATLYAIAVHRTRSEQELRDLSLVDELTKLYNRRGFMTLAEQQLKVAHRTKRELSLFFADLDDLKKINDMFGHDEGDAALVEAAEVLREVFRDSDIAARVGGDEFVVLAIDVAEGKAASLARRLRERLAVRNAQRARRYAVSISLGISRYDPDKPCPLADLIIQADRQMYQDKSHKKLAAAA